MKLKNCPYCYGKVKLTKYKNTKIPLHKKRKKDDPVYVCENYPTCNSFIGCIPKTTEPLSDLADDEVRMLRGQAHKMFDSLWKTLEMTRGDAYRLMASMMGLSAEKAHIGRFNKDQCLLMIEKVAKYRLREIAPDEQWHIFLTRGIWKETCKKIPKIKIPKKVVKTNTPEVTGTSITEVSGKYTFEIPEKIKHSDRFLIFDHLENDLVIYKDIFPQKHFQLDVYKEYKIHKNNLKDRLERKEIRIV